MRFDRPFFCVIDRDSEVGCKGILFFGASELPVLTIDPGRRILSVDPRAFTYFSEPQHLLTAHRFLDSLAERLSS